MTQFLTRIATPLISQQVFEPTAAKTPPRLTRTEMEALFARELGLVSPTFH